MKLENENSLPNGYGDLYSIGEAEKKIEKRQKEGEDVNGFGILWEKENGENEFWKRIPLRVFQDKDKNIMITTVHAELE